MTGEFGKSPGPMTSGLPGNLERGTGVPSGPGPADLTGTTVPSDLTLTGNTVLNVSQNLTVANLTINGSAELIFGNSSWSATLSIDGNVAVSGLGRLWLWDSWTYLLGTYDGERTVYLNDSAHMTADDAFVDEDGGVWDGEFYQRANLTVIDAGLGPHSVLQFHDNSTLYSEDAEVDADVQPGDSATITQVRSAGSALWFAFGSSGSGTYEFPPPNLETNWSFPPPGARGIGYQVHLDEDWPALFAVALDPGSNISVQNSSGIDLAFLPDGANISASGFRLGLNENFSFGTSQFRLHLANVTIDSWSFYPVDTTLTLTDSQLGEVQGWSGSRITLQGSNLTDLGGDYATFDDSRMVIANSTIGSNVWGFDRGSILLENSTVLPDDSIIAVNAASISAFNLTLEDGAGYSAQQFGTVSIHEPLTVSASVDGEPVPGATVTARSTGATEWNSTLLTGSTGVASLYPEVEQVGASGDLSSGPFALTAASAAYGAETTFPVEGPTSWQANLTPLVGSIFPQNGSTDVAANASPVITFGLPMNRSATGGALAVSPAVGYRLLWDPASTSVTVVPADAWTGGSTVELTLGTGAQSLGGIRLPMPLVSSFRVANAAVGPSAPTILSTTPSNGAQQVALAPSIAVEFSRAMDPPSTAAAFSMSPSFPTASLGVNGTLLLWSGAQSLSPGTEYTVTLGAAAAALDGATLGVPQRFSFVTLPDSLVPTVEEWAPSNGTTLAAPPASIQLTWNLPMDPASSASAFSLSPWVPGSVSVSGEDLTWSPSGPLSSNVTYTVSVGAGALSTAGVPTLNREWITFRILAATPTPPSVDLPAQFPTGPLTAWEIVAIGALALGTFGLGFWVRGRRRARAPEPDPPGP